ncbi:MAG TPA: peptidoglycan-binding domain-containing protein [Chthoniobacterales bacterium]|nr:peptidoglycan-binding domain-containing protein [Chthoniobacterales bacterium]
MNKLLTLTCCIGVASLVGAAQRDKEQDQIQYKKKGGNAPVQQQQNLPSQGGKKFKTGPVNNPHYNGQNLQQQNTLKYNGGNKFNKNKWQGPVSNPSHAKIDADSAANTKFNKTKNVNINKNITVNKNFKFQKKQFNLQVNNKQFAMNKYKQVQFNQNYKIAGAHNWKGAKYQVFVNYHPQWHDTWWWNWHHPHVVFIYGGWYYWDNSYWYPAWGYAPDSVYYYDGPIYSSSPAEDPAQTVANVQSALQEQGFYQGDIDGILGPQTRAALAEYQSAQGLEPTGAVDEPTLETLGMV